MVTLASTASVPVAALAPIALAAVGFVAYCLYDLSRSQVRYLPKWVWAIVCLASIPIGGAVYLLVGRDHR